jgi:hypothetical protein
VLGIDRRGCNRQYEEERSLVNINVIGRTEAED